MNSNARLIYILGPAVSGPPLLIATQETGDRTELSTMNPGRGMIVFRITMMRVGNNTVMMLLHRPVAVPETIGPSRNWPAQQEKETKQRGEEAPHKVLFRCVLSLADEETRFKAF